MANDHSDEEPVQPVAEDAAPAEAELEETAPTEADQEDSEAAGADQEETEQSGSEEVTAVAAQAEADQEDDDLICSVCRQPIMLEQEYMNASYGPVHAEPCSHQTVSR